MVQISLDLNDNNIGKLDNLGKEVRKSVLFDATQDMVRFLMMNSPVDHGLLKQWFIASMSDEESHIKSPAKYAIYQDQGTKPHMIKPVNAKALHWDGKFSKGHMVSGIQGKHFVDKSFNQVKPRLGSYLAKALERGG